MPTLFRCPQGHQWEYPRDESVAATLGPICCPACGQEGAPVPTGGETIVYDSADPPQSSPHPHALPPLPSPLQPELTTHDADPAPVQDDHKTEAPTANASVDVGPMTVAEVAPEQTIAPSDMQAGSREPSGAPNVRGFEILGEIGRGGMGVVYRARHLKLNRIVALKMILSGGHAGAADLQRFRIEAEAIGQVQHPNIVEIYSVGEHAGRQFLALEYVDGGNLAQHLDGNPLPVQRACKLVEQLARGIHAAHRHGIVHRDLKPANVLLAPDGTPKIADFGLAKRLDTGQGKTQTGAVLGTPSYMAPEQAAGKKSIGPAADVYALGAILYELLTGRPPFRSDNSLETVLQVISQEVVPPRRLRPSVPRDLETICLKCLHKDPARRYASAADLADDLHRFLAGEPIKARPVSVWERAVKWVRRRPVATAAWAGALLAIAVTAWLFSGDAYRLATNRGRLTVEGGRVGLSVIVRREGKQVAVLDLRTEHTLVLEAGDYEVELDGSAEGLDLSAPRIHIARNGLETLAVCTETVGELQRLDGHRGPVKALALSPNGRLALSGSGLPAGDRTLRLWDMTTGKEVSWLGKGTGNVLAAVFSPDGKQALSGGTDQKVRLWDIASGKEIRTLEGHKGEVRGIAFAPDGQRAVSCGADRTVRLWDTTTGHALRTLEGHTQAIHAVAFSPDGTRIASAGADGTVRLWDPNTGAQLKHFVGRHAGGALCVAFSADGRRIVSGGMDRQARVWAVDTGRLVRRLHGHTRPVTAVAISPEGRQLVSASADRSIRLWDLSTGAERKRFSGHADGVLALVLAPDGRHALSGGGANFEEQWIKGRDFHLRWWALPRPRNGPAEEATEPPGAAFVLRGHTGEVHPVAFSPDGEAILTGGADGALRLWNSETGDLMRQFNANAGPLLAAAFAPNGKQALGGGSNGLLCLWNVAAGKRDRILFGQTTQVGDAAYSPDGKWALTAGTYSRALYLWDMTKNQRVQLPFLGHTDVVQSVAWSPDGKQALSSSNDGTIRLWDAQTRRQVRLFVGHTDQVWKAVVSADGKHVLSASHDGTVRLWDLATGNELLCMAGHRGIVYAAAFTADGRRAVSVGADRTVRVWDLASGEEEAQFAGHTGEIFSVAVSPDGSRAVTGSKDMTARVWRLPAGPLPSETQSKARGQVVLDSDTPAVPLLLKRDGRLVRTLTARAQRPVQLLPGQYTVQPVGNPTGLQITPAQFALQAEGTQRITVRRTREFAGPVVQLQGHKRGAIKLAFTPKADRLVSADEDLTLRLWELPSGKEIRTFSYGPGAHVVLAADGRRAIVYGRGALRVMDLENGKELVELKGAVRAFAVGTFLPGDAQVVIGDLNGTLHLLEIASGKKVRSFDGDGMQLRCLASSSDGMRLLGGSLDGTVRLWDLASGKALRTFVGHRTTVTSVALSPDGRFALSGSLDGTARLWDVASGREVRRLLGHPGGVQNVAFAPDGRRAITWGIGPSPLLVWEVPSGRQLYKVSARQQFGSHLAVDAEARLVAWADPNGILHVHQIPDFAGRGSEPGNTGELVIDLEGMKGTVFVRQNGRVVQKIEHTKGYLGPFALLSLEAGSYEVQWTGGPEGAELAPTRFTLKKGGQQIVEVRRGPGFVGAVRQIQGNLGLGRVAPLPDGRHVLSARSDGTLELWDLDTGRVVRRFKGHRASVWGLDVTRDGKRAASAALDGTLRLWDVTSGKELACVKDQKAVFQNGLALMPNGQQILFVTGDRLLLFDSTKNAVVREFRSSAQRTFAKVALSRDGRRALTTENGGGVTLWDVATGKSERLGVGQFQASLIVAFAPDNRHAVFVGMNQPVRLWDLDCKKEVFRIPLHGTSAFALAFAPDSKRVVVRCLDQSLRVWDLAAREEVYRLTALGVAKPVFATDRRLLLYQPTTLSVYQLPGPGYSEGQLLIQPEFGVARVAVEGQGQTQIIAAHGGGNSLLNLKAGEYTLKLLTGSTPQMKLSAERVRVQPGRLQTVYVRREPIPLLPPDPVRLEAARNELKALLAREADPAQDRERLRGDFHAFLRKYRPLPPVLEAAKALGRLPSALDRLERSNISPEQLKLAGGGDARQAPPELMAVLGDAHLLHPGARCAVFGAGGKWLASAGTDGFINLWDPDTGALIALLGGRSRSIVALAVSKDGKWLASGSTDHRIKVWDVAQRKEVRILEGHRNLLMALAFDPDGKLLVSAAADGVRVWETDTGKQVRLLEPGGFATALAFSPDGQLLACAQRAGLVKIWQTKDWTESLSLRGHTRTVFGLTFSPDGNLLAAGGFEKTVKLYETATGKEVRTFPRTPTLIKGLAFSPDGTRLAMALGSQRVGTRTVAGCILLVDPQGKLIRRWVAGGGSGCWSVAFQPEGKLLASTHLDGRVRLWDVVAGTEVVRTSGHTGHIGGVAFLNEGAVLATASTDGQVKLWDMRGGTKELRSWLAHPRGVWALAVTPDGKLLATAGADGKVALWDAATDQQVRAWNAHKGTVMALAISPDGQTLATGGTDMVVHVWRVSDGVQTKALKQGKGNIINLAFSPDGRFLACGCSDGFLRLWDTASGQQVHACQVFQSVRHGLSFTPDGNSIAAPVQTRVQFWETATGAPLRQLVSRQPTSLGPLALRGDGAELAMARSTGTIVLWDCQTGEEKRELRIRQGATSVSGLAYSPDGRYLVVSESSGLVSILRVALPRK